MMEFLLFYFKEKGRKAQYNGMKPTDIIFHLS